MIVTLLAFLLAAPTSPEKKPLRQLPYTPSLDVSALDRSVDPCAEFYRFSCGGWMKNNPLPPDQASWSVYGKLTDENEQFLWGILEEAANGGAQRTPVQQKIGDSFASCMDEAQIELRGATPLQPQIERVDAVKSVADVSTLLAALHIETSGSGLMFGFGSDQDFGDASQVIAFATAGGLGLPDRDYYTKTDQRSKEIRAKYVAHVQKVLELIGEQSPAVAAKSILQLETALAKASLTRVEKRDPYKLFHKMTRADLQKLTPSLRWDRYFDGAGLGSVTLVNVTEPKFFQALDTQLRNRPLPQWKTYLKWHLARAASQALSSPFVQANFDFYSKTLRGVDELPPRWKRCVRAVDRDLGEALGEEFVRRTFSPKTKEDTLKMTRLIEQTMEEEIRGLDWMGPKTKEQALVKLHGVRNKIGYPDKWRDYSAVEVRRGDHFGNVLRATAFESRRQLAKIGKPLDRSEWQMTPPTVNAYYNPQMNDVNFPAGVLQPPLYDPRMDDAPNYGNTGSTIGHELTHGFDDEGRQFDAEGNLRDWWTQEDAKQFDERVQCVRDQYAQYTIVDDIKINSKLTSGEDVADLGGTLLAYLAWKKDVASEAQSSSGRGGGSEGSSAGLGPPGNSGSPGSEVPLRDGFTPDQRFFIGFAQWACENQRPENLRASAITNPHSPGRYRIDGIVANLPEFAQAFSCKQGAPLVRPKPCRVW